MDERVDRGGLSFGPLLAEGAQGKVFALEGGAVAPGGVPCVAKIYADDALVSPESLGAIVRCPAQLRPAEEAALRSSTAWPLQVIEENGRAVGIVMERVRSEFWHDVSAPNSVKSQLREAAWLFDDRGRAVRFGVDDPSDGDRRALCRALARVLVIFHDNGLVYGDVSSRNVLWTIRPEPGILLLDCDGIRRVGRAAPARQLDSPDWDDPSSKSQTIETDCYKFGLFVARIFARSLTSRDGEPAATSLGEAGRQLLVRALSPTPAGRPRMEEWLPILGDADHLAAAPPAAAEQWVKGADGKWARSSSGAVASDPGSPNSSASDTELAWVKGPTGWVRQTIDTS